MQSVPERVEELIRIVGSERDSRPAELVAYARAELLDRIGGSRADAQRAARRAYLFYVAFGLFLIAAPLAGLYALDAFRLMDLSSDPGLGVVIALGPWAAQGCEVVVS